jgi:cytochrome oxidase Cu insertion factor (SCO1/SenC/PrrC family)
LKARWVAFPLWLVAAVAAAHEPAHAPGGEPPLPALRYELPAAGSYELPAIDRVGAHRLLDPEGKRVSPSACPPGGVAVVGFIYRSCSDATGCPLSLGTLQRLDRAVAGRPELAARVRIATVSFDPEHDRPEQMGQLRDQLSPRSDWVFLTAASGDELRPVLEDYGQDAVPLMTREGAETGVFRHVTKVFLVDESGAVRNVYSTGFLDPRLVLRDIETLLLDRREP